MKPAAMLPTYNEAGNIREITTAILAAHPEIQVVIVDDNSPDGTGRIADDLAKETGRVHPIHRYERRGRGYAGAEGFRFCVEKGFDPIIEMDADFSHDPAYIPQMIAESSDWDIVIGSRTVAGGGEEGRSLGRKIITAMAAFYLRVMTGTKLKDPTSGYRCFRHRVMAEIHPETLASPGPAIVTEVNYRCRKYRIKEIPIRFRDRLHGASKFSFKAMKESLLTAARLRFRGR